MLGLALGLLAAWFAVSVVVSVLLGGVIALGRTPPRARVLKTSAGTTPVSPPDPVAEAA